MDHAPQDTAQGDDQEHIDIIQTILPLLLALSYQNLLTLPIKHPHNDCSVRNSVKTSPGVNNVDNEQYDLEPTDIQGKPVSFLHLQTPKPESPVHKFTQHIPHT